MRNCVVLGSGRSGTSMVTGTLANSGYFMGHHLYPARDGNPKGFFEDEEVNLINEALLSQVIETRSSSYLGRWFFKKRPRKGQMWLARLPLGKHINTPPTVLERIKAVVEKQPFCFKDPRFSYTLANWRPFVDDAAFICVFRNPAVTSYSIMKEHQSNRYLRDLALTFEDALEVWTLMYSHIIKEHCKHGDWLFLHYDQVLSGDGLQKIGEITGAQVDFSFPTAALQRSKAAFPVPEEARALYQELCERAAYQAPETA